MYSSCDIIDTSERIICSMQDIEFFCLIQYISWWHSYQSAVHAALYMPKYRLRAKEMALSRGLIVDGGRKKRGGKEAKAEAKAEEDAILKSIVEENLNITWGSNMYSGICNYKVAFGTIMT